MSKLGLALGGGGARGLAHIGVLKVLEDEGIEIEAITGCSMGAVIGGLYAYFGDARQVEQHILQAINSPKYKKYRISSMSETDKKEGKNYFEQFFDYIEIRLAAIKSLGRLSYFDEEKTSEMFEIIPDVLIEDLKIKFSAIATDLISGEEINFTRGNLRQVIRASSAIPGIFPPVKIDNYLLVDGSASESVPAGKVREIGADRVLAVDVTRSIKIAEPTDNIISILYRTESITSYHLSRLKLRQADLVIRPRVRELFWADFDRTADIIEKGELAARENMNAIKRLVHKNSYLLEMEQYIKKLKGDG